MTNKYKNYLKQRKTFKNFSLRPLFLIGYLQKDAYMLPNETFNIIFRIQKEIKSKSPVRWPLLHYINNILQPYKYCYDR